MAATIEGQLSRARLVGFNPGSEAEPLDCSMEQAAEGNPAAAAGAEEEDTTPSVLNKLQKWANYEATGRPVWPTHFIPMKTPMSREILDNWSLAEAPKHALTVPLLLAQQEAAGRDVGLVIDLANHDCLYSDDMLDSLEYEHVQLIAKVLPSREAINEVERIAKSFWREHPEKFIAIHCAYGFNRTGFVVCSYLCQACGLSVDQALESFAAARPPGVKHDKFIRELYARYGSAAPSLAATPETSSVLGGSPPACPAVDALAAEAELLRQQGAAKAAALAADGAAGAAAMLPAAGATAAAPGPGAGRQQEEDHAFEDAADMVRRRSHRRRSLSRRSSGGEGTLAGTSPAASTPSRGGSAASSRNPSRHGGSLAEMAVAGEAEAGEGAEDASVATSAGVGFTASRKLLLRKASRGGGLSQALAGSPRRPSGGSPHSSGSLAAGGTSPVSGIRTGTSSMSDFAAAAVHLEGAVAGSMRRTTSLGLAKALSEDFLQNNGTPSPVAPISAAADWDEERLAALGMPQPAGRPASSETVQQQQQPQPAPPPPQQQQQQGAAEGPTAAAAEPVGNGSCTADADATAVVDMYCRSSSSGCEGGCASGRPAESGAGTLGSSPSRRGGIPLPALRAGPSHQGMPQQPSQQPSQQQQQQQPGTPATPASSTATPSALSGSQPRQGFQRSVSIDSDNPSLGFGMREALHHLRLGGAAGVATARGPQALADLFREESQAELAALDVDDHLQALEQAASEGLESPAAAVPLPRVPEAADGEARPRGRQPPPLQLGPPAHAGAGGSYDPAAAAAPPAPGAAAQQQRQREQQCPAQAACAASRPGQQPRKAEAEQQAGPAGGHGKCVVM